MNKVKAYGAAVMLALLSFFAMAPQVSAHVLKQSNGVDAVLHIPPDDNPVANKPIKVEFLFARANGGFNLNNYDVKLQILSNDKKVQDLSVNPAFFGAADQGAATVTFPKVAVYELQLTAKAKSQNTKGFSMDYIVRVATSADGVSIARSSNATAIVLAAMTSFLLLGMVAAKLIINGGRYRSRTPKKK